MRIGTIASGAGVHIASLSKKHDIVFGSEKDWAFAESYSRNYPNSKIFDGLAEENWQKFPRNIDLLIFTPSCKNASIANRGSLGEQESDISIARSCVSYLKASDANLFIMENVAGYKKFQSYRLICDYLIKAGWYFMCYRICLTQIGIPQKRTRIYLTASKVKGIPELSLPSAVQGGWFCAVEDVIPSLERVRLSGWQDRMFPEILSFPFPALIKRAGGGRPEGDRIYSHLDPAFTIRALGRGCGRHTRIGNIILDGNVYCLAPRASLRLFGDAATADSFLLPDDRCIAQEIVGNAASWVVIEKLAELIC